jgi:O-antigen/teichoic acid export membrane protein
MQTVAQVHTISSQDLKRRAIRGSVVEFAGLLANQGFRLISNLILSRMLFPEAYGLTAIVTVYSMGICLLTDVGLRESVMRHPRGIEPEFLDTVWTVQVIRGLTVAAILVILAWPISWVYGRPILAKMLMVSAASSTVTGFGASALLVLDREVRRGPLVAIDVTGKILTMVVMIMWARRDPSVWALIAGLMVSSVYTVVVSYFLPYRRSRFRWDREALKEIRSFGQWVLGSSIVTFIAQEGDRLLLGYFLPIAALGMYTIAGTLAVAAGALAQRLIGSTVYGVLSSTFRERPADLARVFDATRKRLDILSMPLLGALVACGPLAVRVLYDDRYQGAGWMVQIMSLRIAFGCLNGVASSCLIARGEPKQTMLGNAMRLATTWGGIPICYHLFGMVGAVWVAALSEISMLASLYRALHKRGIFRWQREIIALGLLVAGVAVGWLASLLLGPTVTDFVNWLKILKHHR